MNFLDGLQYVNIEPTSECNLRCRFCSRDAQARPRQFLQRGLLNKILSELAAAGALETELRFFLSGEPFLHPELCSFIAAATAQGFRHTQVHTNATLIDRSIEHILACGLETLSISMDGWEKEQYEATRRGANFERVVAGARALLVARTNRLKVIIQTIIPFGASLDAARDRIMALLPGADDYCVRHPHSWHLTGLIQEAAPQDYSEAGTCFPHRVLSMYADGRVPVCCADLNGIHILGDLTTQSLDHVWNVALKDFRERIERRLPIPEICDTCERYVARRAQYARLG